MKLYRHMKLYPHTESMGADSGKIPAPFDLAYADQTRPWALFSFFAFRLAFGPVGFKPYHDGRAIDEGFETLKTGTGLAVVEHSGIVLLRFVEIGPLNRRTAGEPRIAPFFLRIQFHGGVPFYERCLAGCILCSDTVEILAGCPVVASVHPSVARTETEFGDGGGFLDCIHGL